MFRIPMLLCVCKVVRPAAVLAAIEHGADSVESVGACTGAGTGCGICVDDIRRLLRSAREEHGMRRIYVEEQPLAAK